MGGAAHTMVHIETVDLSPRGVTLPSDRVGMVIAQPYLSLTDAEPYRCTVETKPRQLQMLTDTLSVARAAPARCTQDAFHRLSRIQHSRLGWDRTIGNRPPRGRMARRHRRHRWHRCAFKT